jgi:hypothetical protein
VGYSDPLPWMLSAEPESCHTAIEMSSPTARSSISVISMPVSTDAEGRYFLVAYRDEFFQTYISLVPVALAANAALAVINHFPALPEGTTNFSWFEAVLCIASVSNVSAVNCIPTSALELILCVPVL